MSDNSPILSLPLIQPSQAQKHVTHNEAMLVLDVAVQLAVKARNLAAPPATPSTGDRYIIAAGASGAWAGKSGQITNFANSYWSFYPPLAGWQAWIGDEAQMAVFTGSAWVGDSEKPLVVPRIGVSATPDATNRLSVSAPATLLSHAGTGHQVKVNKAAAADTASLMFQTGFAGRAEMGLTGNDDFTIKVSPDGTTFRNGLVIDKDDGLVMAMNGFRLDPMAGDLAAPGNGDLWYNSSTGKLRTRQAGVSLDVIGGGSPTVFSDAVFALQDDLDPTKQAMFQCATIPTGVTRVFSLPNTSSELAALNGTQTFTGAKTFSGTFVVSAASGIIGNSTAAASYGVGSGATVSGSTKTVNLGTDGVSGSTTVVNLGSAVAGAGGALVVNSPVVTFANTVTSVAMPQAVLAANYLGLGGAVGDATNRLSVNTPAVLINHAGAGVEATVNKAAVGNDAAIAFKTGFSGRALVGLLGSDDFKVKVSANGSGYFDAVTITAGSGVVSFAQPVTLAGQVSDPVSPASGALWHNATSGQVRVRADGRSAVLNPMQAVTWLTPVAGDYVMTTSNGGGATTTLLGAAGRVDIFPFVPRGDCVIDRLAVNCTTAVAAALGKLVVYASDNLGRPAGLLLETVDLDFGTTGVKTATVAITLLEGKCYWLGVRHSSTATLAAWQLYATPDLNGGNTPVTTARKLFRRTLAYATVAPASWGYASIELNSANATAVWLRLV